MARPPVVAAPECDGPARSAPLEARDSLWAWHGRMRSSGLPILDGYWQATLAREVPGRFAGMYLGSPGPPYIGISREDRRVVVLLADTGDVTRALAALTPYLTARFGVSVEQLEKAILRKARWDFAQLLEWEYFLVPVVRQAVVRRGFGTSVSVFRNRVSFSLPDSAALHRVESRFAALELPCDLVHVEVTGPLVVPRRRR